MIDVSIIVSVGRHPANGAARRAPADAKAVELALSIKGAIVRIVHAGQPDQPVLRDYLGMGAQSLIVLRSEPGADVVPLLSAYLLAHPSDLILSGVTAESGEDSGHVPYLIASQLALPLAPAIAAIEVADGSADLMQALPGGRRRHLRVALPAVATVSLAAPASRLPAFAFARRATLQVIESSAPIDSARAGWEEHPARRRPKRLLVSRSADANERARAASELQSGKGQVLTGIAPEAAAAAIWSHLLEIGVIREKQP